MVKISDILEHGANEFPSSPCAVFPSLAEKDQAPPEVRQNVLTYKDAWQAWQDHHAFLQNILKDAFPLTKQQIETNVVIAYISSNSIDMMFSLLASSSNSFHIKLQTALLNFRWTPVEVAEALNSSCGATTILLYSNEFKGKAEQTRSLLQHKAYICEIPNISQNYIIRRDIPYQDCVPTKVKVQELSSKSVSLAVIDKISSRNSGSSDEDALVLFTSGTTSGSKGVRLSHRALLCQANAKLQSPCQFSNSTKLLVVLVPLFHIGGLSSALSVWMAGGSWIIPVTDDDANTGFDPQIVIQSMSMNYSLELRDKANTLVMVPAMLYILLKAIHDEKKKRNIDVIRFDFVKLILIGGQSASSELLEKLRTIFPCATLVQTFACTEAASSLTFYDVTKNKTDTDTSRCPSELQTNLIRDCIGTPPPHIQLALVSNTNKQNEIPTLIFKPFKVGLLATRGPHVMNGYWSRRHTSKQSPNDWFVTTDLAFRDDKGIYYFYGRSKDVIRTGGETVLATEVERVLMSNLERYLEECAVFPLPDSKFGQVVCVALVLRTTQKQKLTIEEIRGACRNLAGYKLPRKIFHVNNLPRNASGKILKYKLTKNFAPLIRSNL